jgi:hypothetical protein
LTIRVNAFVRVLTSCADADDDVVQRTEMPGQKRSYALPSLSPRSYDGGRTSTNGRMRWVVIPGDRREIQIESRCVASARGVELVEKILGQFRGAITRAWEPKPSTQRRSA